MAASLTRKRVLCVRPRANTHAAPFLAATKSEWIGALSLHCSVHVIEEDFDFRAVCDSVQPDFVIFEMVSWPRPEPLVITSGDAHPHIPRALILNCDPHEPMRPLLYQMLDRYGVTAIFGFGLHHHQQMPELAHVNCYSVPIFFDRTVFRDYGLDKSIPVSVFGGHMAPSFYPWRAQVVAEIQHVFPTLVYPHPGYRTDQARPFAAYGIAYARLLNQSQFSIADTTRLDYVVRKHLEIPASGSILIAPDSPALKDYGFVDMANCILGSSAELYDKIDAVSRDPEMRDTIRRNGHDLVHARYGRDAWTCILDWFEASSACRSGQAVRQQSAMGPFRAVPTSLSRPAIDAMIRDSPLSIVLRQARHAILTGRGLDLAHTALRDVSTWSGNIDEPIFLMGIIALLRAQPLEAAVLIAQRAEDLRKLDLILARLDPCEIAWLLLIATLLGHEPLAEAMLEQAKDTRHLALRRVIWLLDPDFARDIELDRRLPGDCLSVHWLGQESFGDWRDLVERVLVANGEVSMNAILQRRIIERDDALPQELRRA